MAVADTACVCVCVLSVACVKKYTAFSANTTENPKPVGSCFAALAVNRESECFARNFHITLVYVTNVRRFEMKRVCVYVLIEI